MDNTMQTQPHQTQLKRNRGGRPKLPPENRRNIRLQMFFSQSETETLVQQSALAGLQVPDFVRHATLGRELVTVPEVNRQKYGELAMLASNLNQIARQLNSGEHVSDHEIFGTVAQTLAAVQALRAELLGGGR
ncbi:bacterial mobilization protein (MobC) [mine drainage metagenome]|uniref:Bacterial mobilization protein (MobC) n=1 Tax=mine drainage metagenome TaxID=410659 RepID=A0A1J5PSA5_9ZZZZ